MSSVYRDSLAGTHDVQSVARRAFPHDYSEFHPSRIDLSNFLNADFRDKFGFSASIVGYDEAHPVDLELGESADMVWAPEARVNVVMNIGHQPFRLASTSAGLVTSNLLNTGMEDLVVLFNGESVVLTRFAGDVRKYNVHEWGDFHLGMT